MQPIIAIQAQIDNATGNPFIDRRYVDLIRNAGGFPVVVAPVASDEESRQVLAFCQGVLIPGGDDMDPALYGQERLATTDAPVPERDAGEPLLINAALAADRPLLGICRGAQMLQVVLGGPMIQHVPGAFPSSIDHWQAEPFDAPAHPVEALPGTPLAKAMERAGIPLTAQVNSLHHQAIALPLAEGLALMACAPDHMTEAVYVPANRFAWGIQWHPEMMPDDPLSLLIAEEFVNAAAHVEE